MENQIKTEQFLLDALDKIAKENKTLSKEEIIEQKISWVIGMTNTNLSRDEIRKKILGG